MKRLLESCHLHVVGDGLCVLLKALQIAGAQDDRQLLELAVCPNRQ